MRTPSLSRRLRPRNDYYPVILSVGSATLVAVLIVFCGVARSIADAHRSAVRQDGVSVEMRMRQVEIRYTSEADKLTTELQGTLTNGQVTPDALTAIREKFLALSVPSQAQEWHLAVVIELSRLIELLRRGAAGTSADSPQLAKLQSDLVGLMNAAPFRN